MILGATATGKSDLAVELAHWITFEKLGGFVGAEIISADSRQVYKALDIGTGKITQAEMRGIPHHCLDIANPKDRFSVMDWKNAAEAAIVDIRARKKLPIICGGTGFYISALIDGLEFPDVEIDPREQKILEEKTVEELFDMLKKLDPRRAKDMEIGGDFKNKRRVIRAIQMANKLGNVPPLTKSESKYIPIMIGLTILDEKLKERIKLRLIKRLDAGLIEEVKHLKEDGLPYERLDDLGLEYRYLATLLQGELTREQFIDTLNTKIWQYARRQKTWFKRDARIKWFEPTELEKIKKEIHLALNANK